jgi:PQQ-dependent catabolism-associated CXXCW motif protein
VSTFEQDRAMPDSSARTTEGVTDVGLPESDDAPYPGLRSFRRDETHIFFGREGTINEMVDRLAAHRFLAVTGASGSGKSSLVRTGLLDALGRGLLGEAGPDWRIADFAPGDRPLARLTQALAAALGRNFTQDEIAIIDSRLARGPQGLVDWLDEIKFPPDSNILLLTDQFEEIFRYRRGDPSDEIESFVALLLFSAAQRKRRIFVVITMRSDFLGECARFVGLAEAINDGQFLTPRLSRAQCQEAIEGPALVYGGRVEKALVARLLNDLGSNPDELPLMQHILMLMWRKAEDKAGGKEIVLNLAAYEELGGIGPGFWDETGDLSDRFASRVAQGNGALSDHADRILSALSPEQQRLANILFRSLVQTEGNIGRDVRRPTSIQQIALVAEVNPAQLYPIVETFRAPGRNFLTPARPAPLTPATVVDISHESLIRQWRTLRNWVRDEFQMAETYRWIEKTAQLCNRGEAGLLRMPELGRALVWRQKNHPNSAWAARYGGDFDLATRFLDKSRLDRSRRRWTIRAVAACLAIAAAGFGVYQVRQARLFADQAHRIAEAAKESVKLAEEKAKLAEMQASFAREQAKLAEDRAAAQFAQANVANELTDYKVAPSNDIRTNNLNTGTPLLIPGANRLTTPELVNILYKDSDVVLIDSLYSDHEWTIPHAIRIPWAGLPGTFDDELQANLKMRLDNLANGDVDTKLVFFCIGSNCWESYNACMRALHAGYRNVHWYRGGLEAWGTDSGRKRESISQSVKIIEGALVQKDLSSQEKWNLASSLTVAAEVLLGQPHPEVDSALVAAGRAKQILQSIEASYPGNLLFQSDVIDLNKVFAKIYEQKNSLDLALSSYQGIEQLRISRGREHQNNLEFKKDIAEALNDRSNFVLRNRRQELYGDALTALNQAHDIMNDLLTKNASDIDWLLTLSTTEYLRYHILEEQKHLDDSIVHAINVLDTWNKINLLGPSENNEHVIWLVLSEIAKLYGEDGNLEKQIYYYRQSQLAARSALEKYRLSTMLLQDASVSDLRIGDILESQGNLDPSFSAYAESVSAAKAVLEQNATDEDASKNLTNAGAALSKLAFAFELKGQFADALKSADLAASFPQYSLLSQGIRAHALMFLNRTDEARNIYLRFRDQNDEDGKKWEDDILSDFAEFRKAGLSKPLMDEIEALLKPPEPATKN